MADDNAHLGGLVDCHTTVDFGLDSRKKASFHKAKHTTIYSSLDERSAWEVPWRCPGLRSGWLPQARCAPSSETGVHSLSLFRMSSSSDTNRLRHRLGARPRNLTKVLCDANGLTGKPAAIVGWVDAINVGLRPVVLRVSFFMGCSHSP